MSSSLRLNISVLALFVGDRVAKSFSRLLSEEDFIFLKYFRLKYYLNYGVAFSLPVPRAFILGITLLVLVIFSYALIRAYQQKDIWNMAGFSYIIIGATSNIIDRLLYGGVIDFIDLRILPVFNLADLMILFGIGIVVIKYVQKRPAAKKVSKKN